MISANLNIVLVEPEIPQNTGSIGRLCLATGSTLHLVKPLGFSIDTHALKRAGLDYWEHLNVHVHESVEDFLKSIPESSQRVFIETRAGKSIYDFQFQEGAYLILGKETAGLADWILNENAAHLARIPMKDARVRSLNLANATSIVLYEALRQIEFSGHFPL